MSDKPTVFVLVQIEDDLLRQIQEDCDVRVLDHTTPRFELLEALSDVEGVLVSPRVPADAAFFDAAPRLRVLSTTSVGYDPFDIPEATKHGVVVCNTPGVLTEDTADMTLALLLAAPRRLLEGDRLVRSGGWGGWTPTFMIGDRIAGKRLGIIGMGRIGQAVARRARGFNMSIHYHNRKRVYADVEAELEATWWRDLDQMLAHMDYISVNCPLNTETHHLLSEKRLRLLQPHAFVVNTARGEIIDEAALARLLAEGAIAGAALDVYEREPDVEPGLMKLDNVVLAPHLGSATREGRIAMGEKVMINIRAFADGHTPPDRVIHGNAG